MAPFVVTLILLVAQLAKGMTGFGHALVALPLLGLALSPGDAIFITAGTDVVVGATLVYRARHEVQWRLLPWMIVPIFLGQWVGTAWLVALPVLALRRMLAILVLGFGLYVLFGPSRATWGALRSIPDDLRGRIRNTGLAAGLASGLAGGLLGTPGPPLVAWSRAWFDNTFGRAQLVALFLPSSVLLVGLLWARGAVSEGVSVLWLWALPGALVGGNLGAWLAPRVSRILFTRIVGLLLLGAALALVASARG